MNSRKALKYLISLVYILLVCCSGKGQSAKNHWYSENTVNGVTIQNSFPKGGPYYIPTKNNFNYSYLVFFTRIVNETEDSLVIKVEFSADSIAIPNSPDTFVKVFLPSDTMTIEKQTLFSYGVTEIESMEEATLFERTIVPEGDCLFYIVAIFYQTKEDAWEQERGGNRAELVMNGQELFYNMLPQIDFLPCGNISFVK